MTGSTRPPRDADLGLGNTLRSHPKRYPALVSRSQFQRVWPAPSPHPPRPSRIRCAQPSSPSDWARRRPGGCRGRYWCGPNGEPYPGVQFEEGHGAMRKLGTNNPVCREAKTIPIKAERCFQIINADGNDGNAWLHMRAPEQAPSMVLHLKWYCPRSMTHHTESVQFMGRSNPPNQ